jgi:solute carrier family 25 iron transporter 28/37
VITASDVAVYSSLGNAVQRIASTEGLRTLWRGVASVIMGAGPAHAVHFGTYEAVKELAGGNKGGHHPGATRELLDLLDLTVLKYGHLSICWRMCNHCE